jgi:CBS domain containing-hemolysin-like protein
MKTDLVSYNPQRRWRKGWSAGGLLALMFVPTSAHASIFEGETLDNVANVLTWVVLVVAPLVAIAVFLLIHILPEKIAEKKGHPQTKAIQCLCLLSLFFGGILWPLAWLWAYTKPVIHKLAYGTDKMPHHDHDGHEGEPTPEFEIELEEIRELRKRVAELEIKEAAKSDGGKG